jgi:hypothetical protein
MSARGSQLTSAVMYLTEGAWDMLRTWAARVPSARARARSCCRVYVTVFCALPEAGKVERCRYTKNVVAREQIGSVGRLADTRGNALERA